MLSFVVSKKTLIQNIETNENMFLFGLLNQMYKCIFDVITNLTNTLNLFIYTY